MFRRAIRHRRPAAVVTVAAVTPISVPRPALYSLVGGSVEASGSRRHVLSESMAGMNKSRVAPEVIDSTVFQRLHDSDFHEIDRIYGAYMEYFNHIKFRKGWDKPRYVKDEVEPMFREAAEYVYRIRQHLDHNKPEGEATLRMLDGEAQKFLQSDTGPRLVKKDQSQFVSHLVHATLSDARGYVEGLTPDAVNRFVARLQRHRFCPAEHLKHVLLEGLEIIDKNRVEAPNPEEPLHYVNEGSDEDKAWRASISSAYDAVESALKALEVREKALAKEVEQTQQEEKKGSGNNADGAPPSGSPPSEKKPRGDGAPPS